MKGPSEQRLSRTLGCVFALSIGAFILAIVNGGLWLLTGRVPNPQEDWGLWLFGAVFIAAPFGFLVLNRVNAKTPWITAVILTVVFWGFLYAVTFERPYEANNMGLLLLVLLSPLIIIAGAFAAHRVARGRL